ncbi:MAG: PQQ-binding-like beta-propeller repeat protein [Deltaproteobacteria bacterium]|nr:PQQ-binding-like beta-propeller repeat protein [Deltaproteobacteria bacterium]MBW2400473.1 PQQ-binding-like beta-propeller repeat protein [Deltaproteobacteria bacterium]MBW2665523.1 PQQ-binding-like beta-propeller repeat protein [Deltaproteobacteria bacterium]
MGENGAPDTRGRWHPARETRERTNLSDEQRLRIEALEAIGYLAGTVAAGSGQGVAFHDRAQSGVGFNFYTSGHGPDAVLMDMDGRELHRWHLPAEEAWPGGKLTPAQRRRGNFWRRAHLFENGDVLALFAGRGIIKIDKDSKLLWARRLEVHHDLAVAPNGDIYVLTRWAHLVPRVHPTKPIFEDFVVILDSEGAVKNRVSILECFENSDPGRTWLAGGERSGDLFHTNTVTLLDGRLADAIPAFAKGNVLTAMRAIDTIAVLDLEQKKLVWVHRGSFRKQHDPQILDNRHLLLFDNRGTPGKSAILEFDPITGQSVWEYRGSLESPFFSKTCGATERLSNGNTLVIESDRGRAFEVTPASEIVWEFLNPHRAGDEDEFIATLFDLTRLPASFPIDWAQGAPAPE